MIPYIQDVVPVNRETVVLEVGCGEGGNLLPFCRMGCRCVGIDLARTRIDYGKSKLPFDNVTLICKDIHDVDPGDLPAFDLIFSRDVLEHLHEQERFAGFIKKFLKPTGVIFFAFPPWYMPFGGHQQGIKHRLLSRLPFYHVLPTPLYVMMLRAGGVPEDYIAALLEIKQTGISIRRFKKIINARGYHVLKETYWLVNPNYETKFHLTPRKLRALCRIPGLREFLTTCYYCIVRPG
jgi:SAM-dependent methyltransferase